MTLHKTVGLAAVLVAALASGACATKKHVREAIAPVQSQVGDIQKQTAKHTTAIGDLDRNVASADEKATDARKVAGQGLDAANNAQKSATLAGQRADSANDLAGKAQAGVTELDRTLKTSLQNLDNYKLVSTKQVFFPVGRSVLTKDALAELDSAVMELGSKRNYVVEVQGFADRTGNKNMNLELSRMRADAVVRYLTVEKTIPLRDIRELGIGSEFPNAVNKTKTDRQNNRRVDVKIYALDVTGMGAMSGNSADRAR